MRLQEAITDYLAHIRHERKLARNTCEHYTSWLHHFTDWLTNNGYPDPELSAVFTLPVLRRYQYAKDRSGVRPRTVLSAFHSLRGMGEFLVANGRLEVNPVKQLTMPKKDAARREEVTDEEVRALFDACERQAKARQIALSRAVLCVLAYGGLRRQEVCDLHKDDVNLSEKSILVRSGKGSKSRKIFVCTEAVNALREWLTQREKDCRHDYLFTIDRNRRLHHEGIASLIETLKATAGLRDRPITPHCLRHWAATNLMRNGANLRDVQNYLGHSDIATTGRYLHSSEEQLRSISELTGLRRPEPPKEEDHKVIRLPVRDRQERQIRRRFAR